MTGRSPARLLAPVALVAAAVALFVVLSSPSGDETTEPAATTPTATASATPERKRDRDTGGGGTYTVQPGDTLDAIAVEAGVEVEDLIAANPDVEATALTVGDELELP